MLTRAEQRKESSEAQWILSQVALFLGYRERLLSVQNK